MNKEIFVDNELINLQKTINRNNYKNTTRAISPTQEYHLEIDHYIIERFEINVDKYRYNYYVMKIYRNNTLIFTLYCHTVLFFEWIVLDENTFLLCSDYYQCYGIMNLSSLEYKRFIPEEVIDGNGFIWLKGYISPNKNYIAIEGCIWAFPYQIKVFNISDPMNIPYKKLIETDKHEEYSKIIGWKDNNTFLYCNENNEIKELVF